MDNAIAAASTWSQTRSTTDKLTARNAIVTAMGVYQQAERCSVIDARSGVVSLMALVIANDKPQYAQGDVYRYIGQEILGSEMPVVELHVTPADSVFAGAVDAANRFYEHVAASADDDPDDAVADDAAAAVAREVMAVADKIATEGKISRGDAAGATWHAITVSLAAYHDVSQLDVLTVLIDIQRGMPDAYQASATEP